MPDVIPPVHDDPVDMDALTEAITALVRHEAGCADCDRLLPGGECATRAQLKATWRRIVQRRELREAARLVAVEALRRGSVDYGSAGGQMTAEEPGGHPVRQ